MKNRKILSLLLTGAMTAALLAAPAQAAETPPIRVSSYKGNTLEVGERSGLIIGPSGMDYTVTSSNPDTVLVEQITGFWVAVAKSEGTAVITAANRVGASGTLTLTVGSAYAPASPDSANQPENLEIRQELIRLINQTRKASDMSELPVNEALMNAAQHALDNRINAPGHFQTMIDPACDCIGVGVTQHDGITYCFMFVGIPNSVNFYA